MASPNITFPPEHHLEPVAGARQSRGVGVEPSVSAAWPLRVPRMLAGSLVGGATAMAILGIAAIVLLSPPVFHLGLDVARSAEILGLDGPATYRASDLTVAELVAGPATFAFPVPEGGSRFYDPSEAAHLRDVRVVLAGFLSLFVLAFLVLSVGTARLRHEAWFWQAVGRGAGALVVGFSALGALLVVAFDPLFTLFHVVFFPGGNWAFDPTTERMVQLYPTAFWEYAAAVLAVVGIVVGVLVWWFAHSRVRRPRSSTHERRVGPGIDPGPGRPVIRGSS